MQPMDPFSQSLEPRATVADAGPPRSFTRLEIGPRDLPEPAGGYVELVLDGLEDPAPSSPPACAQQTPPTSLGETLPNASPVSSAWPGPGSFPMFAEPLPRREKLRSARPESRSRWLLLPEVLVVAAFVLAGGAVAGAAYRARPARTGPVAATAPGELAPRSHPGRRGPAQARAASAPPGPADAEDPADREPEEEAPPAMEAPVEPEPPPAPSVAPWGGGG
jgi:hypothetical protein